MRCTVSAAPGAASATRGALSGAVTDGGASAAAMARWTAVGPLLSWRVCNRRRGSGLRTRVRRALHRVGGPRRSLSRARRAVRRSRGRRRLRRGDCPLNGRGAAAFWRLCNRRRGSGLRPGSGARCAVSAAPGAASGERGAAPSAGAVGGASAAAIARWTAVGPPLSTPSASGVGVPDCGAGDGARCTVSADPGAASGVRGTPPSSGVVDGDCAAAIARCSAVGPLSAAGGADPGGSAGAGLRCTAGVGGPAGGAAGGRQPAGRFHRAGAAPKATRGRWAVRRSASAPAVTLPPSGAGAGLAASPPGALRRLSPAVSPVDRCPARLCRCRRADRLRQSAHPLPAPANLPGSVRWARAEDPPAPALPGAGPARGAGGWASALQCWPPTSAPRPPGAKSRAPAHPRRRGARAAAQKVPGRAPSDPCRRRGPLPGAVPAMLRPAGRRPRPPVAA